MADTTGKPFADGGAYSSDCYASWSGIVTLLHKRGATLAGAETVLRSKHMRWCADQWPGAYGKATVKHFAAYLDSGEGAREMAGIKAPKMPRPTPLDIRQAEDSLRAATAALSALDPVASKAEFGSALRNASEAHATLEALTERRAAAAKGARK
jgi:hypothetical protein